MRSAPPHLNAIVQGAVDALGYEFVGVEYLAKPTSGHLLRIYIDSDSGIGLTDCERVSHQVSGVLDVDDPIQSDYVLEVSSPGFDRPLFEIGHFERFAGQIARVKMKAKLNGKSNYKGVIHAVDGSDVVLRVAGEPVRLPFAQMASARLVPEL